MLLKIIAFLKGYIKVKAIGGFPERFLNLCAAANRDIWQVKTEKDGISFCADIREYKNLRLPARRTGVKMRVAEKHGLPFFVFKYRKRKGLAVGAVCFVLLISFLSGSVWNITVSGNEKLTEEQVIKMLSDAGIREGTRVAKIDEHNTAQRIMLNNPEISWLSINPMGSTLYVDVKERKYAPELSDKTPQNIVAAGDGVITSIKVNAGDALVKAGDAVTKGQVLISGIVTLKNGTTVIRAADGQAQAQVHERVTVFEPFEKPENLRTGRTKTGRLIHFFGIDIPLFISNGFENYEKEQSFKVLSFAGKNLPIGIYKTVFYELKEQTVTLSEEQAVQLAEQKADEEIKQRIFQNHQNEEQDEGFAERHIVSKEQNTFLRDDGAEITIDCICVENIAEKQKIEVDNQILPLD